MNPVQFVGPYSSGAYSAANQIAAGGSGVPGNTGTLNAANDILSAQPTGSGTVASTPVANPNQALIDIINSSINQLPGQLQTADNNIQNQFTTNDNQLNSGKDQANASYNTATLGNNQSFQTNKNQIQDQASSGLQGLLRVLGAHGAGGSSAALYNAPSAVSNVASQQQAGAANTFGTNQQGLDTNWNNYLGQYSDQKKQLNDWLQTQLQGAQSTSDQTNEGLQEQIAELQPSVAAAQPQVNAVNSLAQQVSSLGKLTPTYTGVDPVYTPPSVSSYTATPTQINQSQPTGTTGTLTPALYSLLGLDKNKNSLVTA